ncbi:molybdopterin-dependent oxidoreductase [Rhodoblastus sp.]|uniref:molybdopterin-dependent oxidoreductase n=1 Tax=Rhodoblastus sp. TaxID=1962975 RepID=UPI003F9C821D
MTAAAGATAGLELLRVARQPALAQAESVEDHAYTICNFCSSLCNVRVTTRTRGGVKRVVKLDGNPYSTLNRGKMCARGQSGLRQTYDSDRIKTPLIRVEGSKRGEFAFRPASWQEAFAYIDRKTKAAAIKPFEWTMIGGWTSCVFYMNWAVSFALANEIPNIIASPMQHCVTTGHFGTDMVTGNFNIHEEVLADFDNARYILMVATNGGVGGVSTCRMVRFAAAKKNGAKVVALDPRRSETAAKADEWIQIRPGTDLAFCLAMLNVMLEEELYDDIFLARRTNMPFLVAKNAAGEWRLETDAEKRPLVVEEDSTEARALAAFGNDNFHDARGKPVQPALVAPEGLRVNGKPAITVMQAQMLEVRDFTPEWAARSTGVDAATIRRIAREFGTTRPAIIDPGWHGARYNSVLMLRRVQAMLQALNGGIDKFGGWIMGGEFHDKAARMYKVHAGGGEVSAPLTMLAGMPFAKMVVGAFSDGKNFSHGHPGWAWAWSAQQKAAGKPHVALPVMADTGLEESVKGKLMFGGEPYRTRALLINAANPVRHYYPDSRWKEILSSPEVELVVAVDVLPSDTTPYADVILPNSTYLERSEPTIYGNGVDHDLCYTTRYAAIDPLYETEETPDILLAMTHIISGAEDRFLETIDKLTGLPAAEVKEAYARAKSTGRRGPFSAACREVSFRETAKELDIDIAALDRELRQKGIYRKTDKATLLQTHAMPHVLPLPTDSGRIEFYAPLLAALRDGGHSAPNFNVLAGDVPVQCRPGKTAEAPLDRDEFYFAYGKVPTVSYASTNSNNPVIAAINQFRGEVYFGLWIHPDRAHPLGVATGDEIEITNALTGQSARGHAFVTRMVHRDVAFHHSSFGGENKALTRAFGLGTATNKLIPYQVEPVVAGFRSQEFTVKVAKTVEARPA